MSANTLAMRRILQEVKDIDRRINNLKDVRTAKERALRRLEAQEELKPSQVGPMPALVCR
jgi:hypothetical protein